MKCAKCGMELGQKNLCPVCDGKTTAPAENPEQFSVEVYDKNGKTGIQFCENSRLPSDDSVRIRFQQFLDENRYDWEAAFERNFAEQEFEFYVCAYEACKFLWAVREFLLDSIRATDAERITPPFMIQVMKQLQEKFPEYPLQAARQWLTELFNAERSREAAFENFARSFKQGDPAELGEMVYVSPAKAKEGGKEQKKVFLDKPVWIQKSFVRPSVWTKILPGDLKSSSDPCSNITWDDAMLFCKALTAYCRRKGSIPDGYAYTLPDQALCQFIAGKGLIASGCVDEWLWNDQDGSQEKPVVYNAGSGDAQFKKIHRDTRENSLIFRVILAPIRPGCVWDEVQFASKSSGSSGLGLALI